MPDVFAVVQEEQAAVKKLQENGSLGAIKMAVPQGKVFIETNATDADAASKVVASLPMAKWWDIETYLISGTA